MNENYFETPNLENCYWAGFLAADGNVSKKGNAIKLLLAIKDLKHLEKYCECLDIDKGRIKTSSRFLDEKEFWYCYISFSSKKMKEDLAKNFNIVPAKTFIYTFPNIEDFELKKSFAVGAIDGDGSISQGGAEDAIKYIQMNLLGTEIFCNWFRDLAMKIVDDYLPIVCKHKNVYAFGVNKKKCVKLLDILNLMEVPKLERKWERLDLLRREYGQYAVWSVDDKKIMIENHPNHSIREIREKFFPDRTYTSVEKYAQYLNLKKQFERPWTEEEDKTIINNYQDMTLKEIVEKFFPYRNYPGVKCRVRYLKCKKLKK